MNVIWYAGHGDGSVAVIDGATETPLPHLIKHSPDGFSWGYGGSGPAELARCLLIHALGEAAVCRVCEGTGWLVYGPDDRWLSVEAAEQEWEHFSDPVCCWHCEDGIAVMPADYQEFKAQVVARLPVNKSWSMPQSDVLAWWSQHRRAFVRSDAGGDR